MTGALSETFSYNALGLLTADAPGTYAYTPTGRLATMTGPVAAAYGCDPDDLPWTRTATATACSPCVAPAETTKPLTVPIVNDSALEFLEQFTVGFGAPVQATVGSAAIVSILDDDRKEWTSGQQAADFDDDGLADYAVFNSQTGNWTIKLNASGTTSSTSYGQAGDIPVVGDYDGNGTADKAVFRPSTSAWYASSPGFTPMTYGQAGDLPVAADYDGDGKTDVGVFRPSNGTWYVQRSTAGALQLQYGQFGDVPVPADYDGDGDADIGVYRPWTGGWYIVGQTPVNWGTSTLGDVPLPGDYDGDGIDDIAVFRRNSGIRYLSQSGAGYKTLAWGEGLTDYPTPGNFVNTVLGLELAIYRPTGGHWYVHTGTGYFIVNLGGQAGDIPALRRQ